MNMMDIAISCFNVPFHSTGLLASSIYKLLYLSVSVFVCSLAARCQQNANHLFKYRTIHTMSPCLGVAGRELTPCLGVARGRGASPVRGHP